MVFFAKSQSEPPCLVVERGKARGRYDCEDVIKALKLDFKGKCYLCELNLITVPNVDHFVSLSENPSLRLAWENLFLFCGRCNILKGKRRNLLNCTKIEDDVDVKIEYRFDFIAGGISSLTSAMDDEKVNNTIKLLLEIYNGSTVLGKIAADHLQDRIRDEIEVFDSFILKYFDQAINLNSKEFYRKQILRHLSNASAFTAFKRWIIRDNEVLMAEFAHALS